MGKRRRGRLLVREAPGAVRDLERVLLAGALRRRGVPLPEGIFTLEQLEAAILACRREGAPC